MGEVAHRTIGRRAQRGAGRMAQRGAGRMAQRTTGTLGESRRGIALPTVNLVTLTESLGAKVENKELGSRV